jgi:D-proline reductase (dithiol) PrdB
MGHESRDDPAGVGRPAGGGETGMSTTAAGRIHFAPDDDVPIPYMQRTRDYYLALGYGNPYRWAHFSDVPFVPLAKPLAGSRVALVTTAAPYQPEAGDQGPGAPYNAAAKFYQVYSASTGSLPDVRISHLGYDRVHTTAADPNTYFPLARLREAAAAGRIAGLTPRLHGAPTNRSQRVTIEVDAPDILRRCREDGADAVVLVPN